MGISQAAAAADFRRALDVAPSNWPHRAAVEGLLRDAERQLEQAQPEY